MSIFRSFYAAGNFRIYYNIYSHLKKLSAIFTAQCKIVYSGLTVLYQNECHDYSIWLLLKI